jgi:large subunit ribosomal protein LP1
MSNTNTSTTTTTTNPELATSYAALILADASLNITADKLQTLIKAAGVEDVEPIWTTLFAKALKGKDLRELLTAVTAEVAVAGKAKGAGVEGCEQKDGGEGTGDAVEDGNDGRDDDADDSDSDIGMSLFD